MINRRSRRNVVAGSIEGFDSRGQNTRRLGKDRQWLVTGEASTHAATLHLAPDGCKALIRSKVRILVE